MVGPLENIVLDQTYVAIPEEGGQVTVNITATEAWAVTSELPSWLNANVTEGQAGETKLVLSAEASNGGREAEIQITAGANKQMLLVRQGSLEASSATCKEVIAGPDSKTYRVTGTVTAIANTTYGNWYLNDGTGEVYIYGTLDKDGATKNFSSLGIELGDVVTVEGPKTTYGTTVELVNVTVLKIVKSLIKVAAAPSTIGKDGGIAEVKIAYKGNGAFVSIPEEYQSWISLSGMDYVAGVPTKIEPAPADTAIIKLNIAANDGGARAGQISVSSANSSSSSSVTVDVEQEGSIQDLTCAQFNAQEDGNAQYKVHGVITSIVNDTYGNYYINDGTGEVYVYGTLDAEGNTKNFASLGLKVGDEVTLQSVKTSYKNAPQMKNAVVVSSVAHDTKTVAELKALEDDKNTYYYVTGTVCHAEEANAKFDLDKYGNFGLQDETGIIYVYGVTDALDGVTKNFGATGVKEGDKITMLAYKTSYNGTIEIVGKFIKKESAE